MEKNIKKSHICNAESLCCIAEINTTQYIDYTSTKKIDKEYYPSQYIGYQYGWSRVQHLFLVNN